MKTFNNITTAFAHKDENINLIPLMDYILQEYKNNDVQWLQRDEIKAAMFPIVDAVFGKHVTLNGASTIYSNYRDLLTVVRKHINEVLRTEPFIAALSAAYPEWNIYRPDEERVYENTGMRADDFQDTLFVFIHHINHARVQLLSDGKFYTDCCNEDIVGTLDECVNFLRLTWDGWEHNAEQATSERKAALRLSELLEQYDELTQRISGTWQDISDAHNIALGDNSEGYNFPFNMSFDDFAAAVNRWTKYAVKTLTTIAPEPDPFIYEAKREGLNVVAGKPFGHTSANTVIGHIRYNGEVAFFTDTLTAEQKKQICDYAQEWMKNQQPDKRRFIKSVKGAIMESLFDECELFMVKYYENLSMREDEEFNENKTYRYVIRIRHPEGTDGKALFDQAVKESCVKVN